MGVRAIVVAVSATVLVLVGAAPALAKGADQVTITGPGLAKPIVVTGYGEPGAGGDLGTFSDGSGIFPAIFGTDQGPGLVPSPPPGPLGPKYELAYRIPSEAVGGDTVLQDLYPSAPGGPVTYTAEGQQAYGNPTRGGWFRGTAAFAAQLTALGIPDVSYPGTAPVVTRRSVAPSSAVAAPARSGGALPWVVGGVALAVVVVLGAGLVLVRRRRS